jgi:hypothetical protein
MSEPRATLTRSHFTGSASLFPRLAFRRTPWLRPRYGHRVPASRAEAFHLNSSCARLVASHRLVPPRTASLPALLAPVQHAVARCSCSCVARVLLTRLLHASRTPAQRLRQLLRVPALPVPCRSPPSKPSAPDACSSTLAPCAPLRCRRAHRSSRARANCSRRSPPPGA